MELSLTLKLSFPVRLGLSRIHFSTGFPNKKMHFCSLGFFFFFFDWRHNPLWVLAFSVILFHYVLSLLNFLQPLIPIDWISSSISSTHLFLGLPLILLPVGFHSTTLLGIPFSSIHITCPNQAILLLSIDLTMSAFPQVAQFVIHSDSPGSIFILYWAKDFP